MEGSLAKRRGEGGGGAVNWRLSVATEQRVRETGSETNYRWPHLTKFSVLARSGK